MASAAATGNPYYPYYHQYRKDLHSFIILFSFSLQLFHSIHSTSIMEEGTMEVCPCCLSLLLFVCLF